MKKGLRFFYSFGFLLLLSHPQFNEVYITGLNLKENKEGILIEWFANTNSFTFLIFKNYQSPIFNSLNLTNSILIFSNNLNGETSNNLFYFSFLDYEKIYNSNIFYIILPSGVLKEGDFKPETNFNVMPFVLYNNKGLKKSELGEEQVKKGESFVVDLFYKRYGERIILIWNVSNIKLEEDISFNIYKDTKPISNIDNIIPYITNLKDFYFEDFNIDYTNEYYYAILINDNKVLNNMNTIKIEPEKTFAGNIITEREIIGIKKVKKRDFLRNLWKKE